MTPMQIQWCLTFWCSGDPIAELGDAHFNSPAGKDVMQWMIDEHLIAWDGPSGRYLGEDRLQAFIEHLCAQPLPVQKWVMPTP